MLIPAAPAAAKQPAVLAETAALVAAGRFDEALPALRALTRPPHSDADAGFLLGLAAMGAAGRPGLADDARDALLDEAVAVLHALLAADPGLDRVRLELARAFFLKGEDGLAREHFERVLASDPPAPVAVNIRRFLAEIQARRRWSLHAGMALMPDSNIGTASGERTIYIYGLPFRRDESSLPQSGVGVSLWVGGEYEYPLDRTGTGRLRLRAGGDLRRSEYSGSAFDRMALSAHLGPRWLIGPDTEASVLAVARQHWLSGDPHYRDLGLRVEVSRRLGHRLTATLRASRLERRFREGTELNGPITDVSLGANYLPAPGLRLDLAAGWSRERPRREDRRNTGRWVRAGMTTALPRGFTVSAGATLRLTGYEGEWLPFTALGEARRDRTRIFRVGGHHRALTLWGFSPRLSLVREDRTSSAQSHGYERIGGELSFVRQF